MDTIIAINNYEFTWKQLLLKKIINNINMVY